MAVEAQDDRRSRIVVPSEKWWSFKQGLGIGRRLSTMTSVSPHKHRPPRAAVGGLLAQAGHRHHGVDLRAPHSAAHPAQVDVIDVDLAPAQVLLDGRHVGRQLDPAHPLAPEGFEDRHVTGRGETADGVPVPSDQRTRTTTTATSTTASTTTRTGSQNPTTAPSEPSIANYPTGQPNAGWPWTMTVPRATVKSRLRRLTYHKYSWMGLMSAPTPISVPAGGFVQFD